MIAAISMVRNEADVIESFVRHTLRFADWLYITDHRSEDATREILSALVSEGLPILVTYYEQEGHAQSEIMTKQLYQAIDDGADIVLALDGDEFLLSYDGSNTKNILLSLSKEKVYGIPYYASKIQNEAETNAFCLSETILRSKIPEPMPKVIMGRGITQKQHLGLLMGNHFAQDRNGNVVPLVVAIDNLYLAHFQWRSKSQIQWKIGNGWLADVVKFTRYIVKAPHWHDEYERMKLGKKPGIEDITDGVMVSMPEIPLRYGHLVQKRETWNPYKMAEDLAEEVAELRFLLRAVPIMIIIPFTGDLAAFQASLESVLKLDYVKKKILVCIRQDSYIEELQTYLKELSDKVSLEFFLLDGGVDIGKVSFEDKIQGDYVEILLPGVTLKDNMLRVMGAVLDKAPLYSFLLANESLPDAYTEGAGHLDEGNTELEGRTILAALEQADVFLEQDISAALFRKDFLLKGNLIGRILAAKGDRRVVWHDVLAAAERFGVIEETFLMRAK